MTAKSEDFYSKSYSPGDERILAVMAANPYTVLALKNRHLTAVGFDDRQVAAEYLRLSSGPDDEIRMVISISADLAQVIALKCAACRLSGDAAS